MQYLNKGYMRTRQFPIYGFALITFLISFLIIQVGCKKFVQISPPSTQLVTASVFNNSSTATSALTNIYQQMYKNAESFNMAKQTGIMGDELTNYSTNAMIVQYYTNSMSASSTFGPWNNAYNYIYQANAIIEGLQNNNAIIPAIKQQLIGESKFIRAFWHFYLTNCYGDVPIVTTTNYKLNSNIYRSAAVNVYQQIISDLKDAQNMLNTNFVDASDTANTVDRIRPTKWAASALLARIYLYTGNYSAADEQASVLISNGSMFSLVDNLSKVFLANSSEAIWQLGVPLPNPLNYNTIDGHSFILKSSPNNVTLSPQLINAFEVNDNRKNNWIGSYTTTNNPVKTFYYPYKYQIYTSTDIEEYTMMLRLAEQYLIRAEARAKGAGLGLAGAISDLNVIRNRAGLSGYTGPSNSDSVLIAIFHERQVELFAEWGNRWFDLIRSGNINSVMGVPGNVCQNKGGVWDSNWELFPVPQSERNNDPNLTQNPGY